MGWSDQDGWMGSMHAYVPDWVGGESPEWRAKQKAEAEIERTANTYRVIIGNVEFIQYFHDRSPVASIDGEDKRFCDFAIAYLPDACIPADISRESLTRYVHAREKGYISGQFEVIGEKCIKASESWHLRLDAIFAKVRRIHCILIDGEECSFPIINMQGYPATHADALVNGQAFPLKRSGKYWVLDTEKVRVNAREETRKD